MLKTRRFTDELTPIDGIVNPDTDRRMCLLIIGEGFVGTHPLPDSGDLIIGRSEDADVCIDVPSVSRRHALLHIGSTMQIEDLGSANGTFVHDQRLERGVAAALQTGAMFEVGSTMLIVQDSYTAARPRRIWTHGYFEARLEEECTRGGRANGSFSLLRIRTDGKKAKAHALHELLLAALRPSDILATYGPDDFEVLVVDATVEESTRILRRICDRLSAKGAQVRTGIASFPHDGRVPEALMARACAQIEEGQDPDEVSGAIVVESPMMKTLHKMVERVAASDINVLILGETGVGKEVFAERIHTLSSRVAEPLLRLNCAALSENLLESELFGHERGAFTGAVSAKQGLLEAANGGTLFLDEIGDMPLSLQAKLLRVLEARCVRRVGGIEPRPIDIRIVAATHRDLETDITNGRFRQDLFFRLNGISIVVPPLRERKEEIEALARSFVAASCKRQHKPRPEIGNRAVRALRRYEWPGNIRELRNVMERAVLLCGPDPIGLEHLPADKMAGTFEMSKMKATGFEPPTTPIEAPAAKFGPRADTAVETIDLKTGIRERERELIQLALQRSSGNQTKAAKLLGISRRTLISKIEDHGLPRPRKDKRK
jgi:DNA-binding NtrC family response regulator